MTEAPMKCIMCRHAVHEQFEGYKGMWHCMKFPKNTNKTLICNTTVEDFGNDYKSKKRHLLTLAEAQTPKWCPLKKGNAQ